ncbi:hypothetical protein GSI_08959 [Ganoderma sinense ZZ0214-1]|uniref:Uncharacterized protein n=1 Tax=Ganoderma sinense ZZ0214-1 TaxID=1077348 RepID=A0A2G8S561_9APHY|nr:hypothetical protein GSI_08959 [Ganoderma sinense ZZ0214-1]
MKMSSENVTIVSPQPLEIIRPQFNFKFIDTAYNLTANSNLSDFGPLSLTLRNKTFEGALFPSKIQFISDSEPPTAEAQVLIFTHPGFAEGTYNLSINEFILDGASKMPSGVTHFDVPVIFSFDPKGSKEEPTHEEL